MSERPCILISNDDGILSPGIVALAEALATVGEVAVVAPERNWSAVGHTRTMHKPLRATQVGFPNQILAYESNGSPSDCVALALLGLVKGPIALVVSGINAGPNMGTDILYSGTFAAAVEGTLVGLPALAVSLDMGQSRNFKQAARYAARVAQAMLAHPAAPPWLLNVNVPDRPDGEISGIEVTRLGTRVYRDALVERVDPRGHRYFWIGGEVPGGVVEEGTDIGAVAAGRVSVTPVRLDLTDRERMAELRQWQWE